MAIFEKFPYNDLHNLNLDWMINKMKEFQDGYEDQLEQIQAVQTAAEQLQRALQEDEENLAGAVAALDAAIANLPQDIQDEVSEQIGPEVASRIGPVVASQLPAIAAPMVSQSVSEWLRDNMTEPPLDPSMSIRSAVPDAKDCGTIFTYLEDLEISGYTRVTKSKQPTIQTDKCWDVAESTGIRTQSGVDAYVIDGIIGGVTYQLDNFYNGTGIPSGYTFRAAFVRDYVSGQALDEVVVYHNRTEMDVAGRWNDDETSFRLRAPFGATALLINQVSSRGTVSISELSNEFIGSSGEEVNVMVALGALNVFTTHYDVVAQALDNSGNVYFKFPADTYDGMTAQVVAFKKNAGLNYSIMLVGPSDKLIKADMTYNSTTLGGQLVNVTEVALGGGGAGGGDVINLTETSTGFRGDIDIEDLETDLNMAIPVWVSYPSSSTYSYNLEQITRWRETAASMLQVYLVETNQWYSVTGTAGAGTIRLQEY